MKTFVEIPAGTAILGMMFELLFSCTEQIGKHSG